MKRRWSVPSFTTHRPVSSQEVLSLRRTINNLHRANDLLQLELKSAEAMLHEHKRLNCNYTQLKTLEDIKRMLEHYASVHTQTTWTERPNSFHTHEHSQVDVILIDNNQNNRAHVDTILVDDCPVPINLPTLHGSPSKRVLKRLRKKVDVHRSKLLGTNSSREPYTAQVVTRLINDEWKPVWVIDPVIDDPHNYPPNIAIPPSSSTKPVHHIQATYCTPLPKGYISYSRTPDEEKDKVCHQQTPVYNGAVFVNGSVTLVDGSVEWKRYEQWVYPCCNSSVYTDNFF